MSAIIQPLFNRVSGDQILYIPPKNRKRNYACRIGFIGAPIDRFDAILLGKVLDFRNFEEDFFSGQPDDNKATALAKRIVGSKICAHYPVERQRLIFAGLTGSSLQNREEQLAKALDWLKTRNVDAIYFQYQWMVPPYVREVKRREPKELMIGCLVP